MTHTPAPATEYKLCDGVLGKGAYGTVVKAMHVNTQKYYAIKCFKVTHGKVVRKASMPMPLHVRDCLLRAANTL
jgi:hypothetical protein